MKKKSGSRVVRFFSSVLKIRVWFDWDRIKTATIALWNGAKVFFVPQQSKSSESFEVARKKLNLTNDALLIKQKALFRLSILMLSAALLLLSYGGYQLIEGSLKAFIVSFVVALIALALAFRYHFWYFQIKQHKLGCTFEEWYKQGILGKKE